jgi:hypothetical protein
VPLARRSRRRSHHPAGAAGVIVGRSMLVRLAAVTLSRGAAGVAGTLITATAGTARLTA